VALGFPGSPFFFPAREVARRMREFSERYGLEVNPRARIWQLSAGEQQRVAIARALRHVEMRAIGSDAVTTGVQLSLQEAVLVVDVEPVGVFHERGRQVEAPSFYLHLQPDGCFVGAGLWHPQSDTLRRVRHFLLDNPSSWKAAAHDAKFRKRFDLDDSECLTRAPRGFPADFEFADDLRRKNFVAFRSIDDDVMLGPRLLKTLETDLAGLAPFTDYLCAALDLEF
jgi:hypothetical protein